MRNLCSVHEENARMKILFQDLKRRAEETAQLRKEGEDKLNEHTRKEFEEEWVLRMNGMKTLYEKIIHGYKEELTTVQKMKEDLEVKLESLVKDCEEREGKIVEHYEERLKNMKLERFGEHTKEKGTKEQETNTVLNLEQIIRQQEIELKNALKTCAEKEANQERFQENILRKLEELLKKHADSFADSSAILSSLETTLKKCFDEMKEKGDTKENSSFLLKENDNLRELLREKSCKLESLNKDLEKAHNNVEKLSLKCEFLESKVRPYHHHVYPTQVGYIARQKGG